VHYGRLPARLFFYQVSHRHIVLLQLPNWLKYLTDTATSLPYSCTSTPEQMVVDALNHGKLVFEQKEDKDEVCLSFARKYGPLGVTPPVKSPLLDSRRNADNSAIGALSGHTQYSIYALSPGKRADGQTEPKRTEANPQAGANAGGLRHELPPDLRHTTPARLGAGKSAGCAEVELCTLNHRSRKSVKDMQELRGSILQSEFP